MKFHLDASEAFENRHHGQRTQDESAMLQQIGVASIDQLIDETVPAAIRLPKPLDLPSALSEQEFLAYFKRVGQQNKIFRSFIGAGYYDTVVPPVILRNILENPAWYTAYTPYQAEIAQGRLEMLLNFQTLVSDLTAMEIANASLLDEGTAAAEAMSMFLGARKGGKKNANTFFISDLCHPQTIDVVRGRAIPLGVEVIVGDYASFDITHPDLFGVLLQYPATTGEVIDYSDFIAAAHEQQVFVTVATDLLALTLLKAPGEMGADAVIGTAQRLGVPMGYGGPHAAFFATKDAYKRQIPGRIIGVSVDTEGNPAMRMALQTREQHIRREKATSNICTAQVLLSVMSAAYCIYHGPEGLKRIAQKIYGLTQLTREIIQSLGVEVVNSHHFDTLTLRIPGRSGRVRELAEERGMNFRYLNQDVFSLSYDETKTMANAYKFMIICCPVGAYYAAGLNPVKILVEDELVRAVKGGTGFTKCGGNYAGSILGQVKAEKLGYAQVLWLDGEHRKYVEEVGTMNIMFKIAGEIYTAPIEGTVLPGVTRDSMIHLSLS